MCHVFMCFQHISAINRTGQEDLIYLADWTKITCSVYFSEARIVFCLSLASGKHVF